MSVPPEVAYVAACALGLAFSEHHGDDAVDELLRAAEGRAETLDAARAVLPTSPCQDLAVVRAADDLLTSAGRAARLVAPAAG